MTENQGQSEPVALAGCGAPLNQVAAGCAHGLSEGGEAASEPQSGDAGAGCAATASTAGNDPAPMTKPATLREFERALRGLGFSKREAEAIARHGFAGATATAAPTPEPEPDTDMQSLMAALQRRAAALKGI